jgi:uncharacterized membrane protein
MTPDYGLLRLPHPRFLAFLAVFAGATVTAGLAVPGLRPGVALITGFDIGAAVFIASAAPLWQDERIPKMRASAERDDGGRTLLLAILGATLVVVMVALGLAVHSSATRTPADLVLVVVTLALGWTLANLVYALHYAQLYYDQVDKGDRGGLAFPGSALPVFADFCYFSFVIGMTCQVSDVAITDRKMRRTALMHGLLSFVFNLGVLALTINVLAGVL